MTDPQDTTPSGPTHEQMVRTAFLGTDAALEGLSSCYGRWNKRPANWPDLAAALQHYGQALVDIGAQFADDLAAYSAAHPTVTVPAGGVAVMLLSGHEHEGYWQASREARLTTDPAAAVAAYAEAFSRDYGRPELSCRAMPIDDTGAVLLLQYVTDQGEDAIVRAYIGGVGHMGNDQLQQALDNQVFSVSAAAEFWPPLRDFWFTFYNDMFDQYGRRVPPERYTRDAPAARGGQDATAAPS